MANPFYNALMNPQQNFHGDPKQQVQNLLSSGQMSQEQFNNLSNMANTFFSMFGR